MPSTLELIHQKAQQAIQYAESADPFRIAQSRSIYVNYQKFPSCIMGFFTKIAGSPVITLANQLTDIESQFTCAHELGHYFFCEDQTVSLLSRQSLTLSSRELSQAEYQANVFATDLLLAQHDLSDCQTRQEVMYRASLPPWTEQFVDWAYIKRILQGGI